MSNPHQVCSICKSGARVVAAVNEALAKKEKFRDLASRTGFSRASLHRHSKRCIPRDTLAQHKARAVVPSGRTVVSWPATDHEPAHFSLLHGAASLHEDDLLPGDCIFAVSYRSSAPAGDSRLIRVSDKLLQEAADENRERQANETAS